MRHQDGAWAVGLEKRQVHESLALFSQALIFAGLDYADNFAALCLAGIQGQAPPDRIFAWPETAGHGVVDDDHRRGTGVVLRAKLAPAQYGDSHRLKVPGSNRRSANQVGALAGRRLMALDGDAHNQPVKSQRQRFGQARRCYAGHTLDAIQQFPVEALPAGFRVAQNLQIEGHSQPVLDLEPRVDGMRVEETLQTQARANEQNQANRDLGCHEGASQARSAIGAIASVFQARNHVEPGAAQGRRQAEDESGEQRNQQCESQDSPIQRKIQRDEGKQGRFQVEEKRRCPGHKQQTGPAGQARKHDAFCQDLPDEAAAAGADSGTNSHFARAPGRSSQDEIGRVRAGDEQDQTNNSHEEDRKGNDENPELRRNSRRGQDGSGPSFVALGVRPRELFRQDAQVRLRLRTRDAGLQAPDCENPVARPVAEPVVTGNDLAQHHHRDPEVRRKSGLGAGESRRRNPDNNEAVAIQCHRPAHHTRVGAQPLPPERICKHHNRIFVGCPIFLGEEGASKSRRDSQHRKEIPGNDLAVDDLILPWPAPAHTGRVAAVGKQA